LRVAAAIGVTGDALERATALVNAGVDAIIIDTAHGHTQGGEYVESKNKFPQIDVIVGNMRLLKHCSLLKTVPMV
jgi:IMP dehydrogenase